MQARAERDPKRAPPAGPRLRAGTRGFVNTTPEQQAHWDRGNYKPSRLWTLANEQGGSRWRGHVPQPSL